MLTAVDAVNDTGPVKYTLVLEMLFPEHLRYHICHRCFRQGQAKDIKGGITQHARRGGAARRSLVGFRQ